MLGIHVAKKKSKIICTSVCVYDVLNQTPTHYTVVTLKHFESEVSFFSSSYVVHINTLTANTLKYINKLKKKKLPVEKIQNGLQI